MTQDTQDIRDFGPGETYFVITSDEKGGRCVLNGMFIAAWRERSEAKAEADVLGAGHHVAKQVKPSLCPKCGHDVHHNIKGLGGICIGCPCDYKDE